MWLLALPALAETWYAESYLVLPEPITIGELRTAQLRQQLVVSCEGDPCVIEAYAIQARAVPGQEQHVQPALTALTEHLVGAEVNRRGGAAIRGGTRTEDALVQRALVGLELIPREGRWEEPAGSLVELPLTPSSSTVQVVHRWEGTALQSEGVGRVDTEAGSYALWVGGEATVEQGRVLERTWWSIGDPIGGGDAHWMQGGCLHAVVDGELPHLMEPTGELDALSLAEGHSVQVLQQATAEHDLRGVEAEGPMDAAIVARLAIQADLRTGFDPVAAGELWLGFRWGEGEIGLGWHGHRPRDYRPIGTVGGLNKAWPVQANDLMLGLHFRRDRLFIPSFGVVWGVSVRSYPGSDTGRIWMPVGGPELGFGLRPSPWLTAELTARVMVDGAATWVTRGEALGSINMISTWVGLTLSSELLRW